MTVGEFIEQYVQYVEIVYNYCRFSPPAVIYKTDIFKPILSQKNQNIDNIKEDL